MDDPVVYPILAPARLRPLVSLPQLALDAADPATFAVAAARALTTWLNVRRCEVWLEEESGLEMAAAAPASDGQEPCGPGELLDRALVAGRSTEGMWLALPLRAAPRPVGVLALLGSDAWAESDVELAETAADVASVCFQALGVGKFDARTRDEFLALVGHDLRSPLSNVRVAAQLALRNLAAGDLDSVKAALTIIEGQSGRLLARLEALLDAVAAEGRRLIRLEPLDLVAMAEAVVAPYRLAAEQSGLGTRFLVGAAGQPGLARGDAVQIGQVIEQLVNNAAKYAAGGQVIISVSHSGAHVRVDVCDDGPGIRPEDRERVFAPFGRGHAAAGQEGYGLGLYLARSIVNAHGGRLWIDRTSRSGTCMAFVLPAVQPE